MADERDDKTWQRVRRAARQLDSQPALLSLAARLRANLPGDDRYGDSLSLAGREAHQLLGKGLSAIGPQRDSLLNEIGRAGIQVWQALAEAQGRGRGQRNLALLFTDLVGFSDWALGAGDARAVELLRAVADHSDEAVRAQDGRVVKSLGDGCMAVFAGAPEAVDAAIELQRRLDPMEVDGYRPRLRAGVHCGRPRPIGGDYLGVDVNITARVAEAAKPGQVLVSEMAAASLDGDRLTLGRPRRLRAQGAPRELRVIAVEVAPDGSQRQGR